ncbi:hypothetical protein CHS0354_026812 [Potamilus streckersoni]|uniref:Mannosyltransferase n=1 Tax=Potamilus streckersoni TaxID=2493646 RepID=A0AAE0T6D4_9BIVA|nr:hypothetical protein CHS0354_026812 [Potamilus streckersoni]
MLYKLRTPVAGVIILSALLHLLTAIFSIGYIHPDEHFQILEFIRYHSAPDAPMVWEFHNKIRSYALPAFLYFIQQALWYIGITDAYDTVLVFRLISSALSFSATLLLLITAQTWLNTRKSKANNSKYLLLTAGLLFLHYQIPFIHARVQNENWGASLFIIGTALLFFNRRATQKHIYTAPLAAGFLLGLAFLFRFQILVMIGPLMLWLWVFGKRHFSELSLISGGIILAVIAGVFVDRWGYGSYTFSFWNYFKSNILNSELDKHGVAPFYYYITNYIGRDNNIINLTVVLFTFSGWLMFPKHVLTWITAPFFLIHSYIGHKEMRFLIPILPFCLLYIPLMVAHLQDKVPGVFKILHLKTAKVIFYLMMFSNAIGLLILAFNPANKKIGLLEFLNSRPEIRKVYFIEHDNLNISDLQNHHFYPPIPEFIPTPPALIQKQDSSFHLEENYVFTSSYQDYIDVLQKRRCDILYQRDMIYLIHDLYCRLYLLQPQKGRETLFTLFKCYPSGQ